MNLKLMLEGAAERHGERTAIISGERRLSYAELDENSNKVANFLIQRGLAKGDRVAILLANNLEYPVIYFGIAKAGGIAVPLDIKYKVDELASVCDDSKPKVMITESPYLEPIIPALPRFKSIEHIIAINAEFEGQYPSYQEIIETSPAHGIEMGIEPEDVALISYTSGPTFRPRGVLLTNRNMLTETLISGDGFQQTYKDISMLFALPLHHMFGLVGILLTAISRGSTTVIVPGLSLGGAMETIERERVTMFMGVPYVYTLMINMAQKEGINYDLSSLRLCASAGAPLARNVIKQFKKYYGFHLIDFWGLTESTCHVTCPPVNGSGKFGSVGRALQGWEIMIVDKNGREIPPNHQGEIIVRGVPVMKGYYNNPQASSKVLKDGWLYTGDIGKLDKSGYLFITGRKKEMIIRKGQNVYPSDVEDILYKHPKVAEAAVVGIQDELRGEVLRAVIRLKEGMSATDQEIKQFCLEHMANYKVPKQIILTSYLPKTVAGEIRKEELKGSLSTLSRLSA